MPGLPPRRSRSGGSPRNNGAALGSCFVTAFRYWSSVVFKHARSQVCADTVSAVAKRKNANAFRVSLLSACAAARTGGRGSRRGRKLRRHRKVALIRRPVRHRQIVGRIEHGRPDTADLVVIDKEPFGQQ